MLILASVLALLLTIAFAVISSGHDASNAIGLPVRHRALRPRTAVLLAAVLNVLGVALAAWLMPMDRVTRLVTQLSPDPATALLIACSALVTAIGWALLTWWRGLPASMGSTLVSTLLGAAAGASATGLAVAPLDSAAVLLALLVPVLLAPVAAFGLSWLLVIPAVALASRFEADQVTAGARVVMVISSTAGHLGHGVFHGLRILVLIAALPLLSLAGISANPRLPLWLIALTAAALGAGSLLGGWRIARTISSRMVRPDALRGAVAQLTAGGLILPAALGSDLQLSTSQTTASALLGAGVNQRFRATNHPVVGSVLLCWLLTVPVCALVAGVLALALSPILAA